MMKARKGAIETSLLMSSIVAVVVLIIGFMVVKQTAYAAEELSSREICRQSVERHADLHIKGFSPPSSTINCPPVYIDFAQDKINYEYRDSKRSNKLPKDEGKKDIAVKKAMADEIYYCWSQFLEGKRDLFGGPKKYCSVCSVIRFGDKSMEVKGFYDYLMKNTVPNEALAKEGVTYFDYMQGYSKKGNYDQAALAQYKTALEGTEMDTSNPYAVVFIYVKSEPFWDNAMQFLGNFWDSNSGKVAVIGGAVLLVGGAVVSMTGIGLPVGGALVTAGVFVIKTVTIDQGLEAAGEAYVKQTPVRDWAAFTVFGPYDENMLKGLGCEELTQR
ncbi:hypothetical protein HYV82_00745 [Candidatus Woesearchaeota archaeon]|nr:hypothetical protein [Candidatus Woesearchaeota archaeon]